MTKESNTSPIATARDKTDQVQHELEVAGAELHLTSTALDRHLPPAVRHGDVARALAQNAAIEIKVHEAAEELAEVTELLEEEVAQRGRLERELARAGRPGPPAK
jgi:hypothetical protein